jgi:hypothetical protein
MDVLGSHIDFVQLLLAVIAFFMIRTLNKIDKNQGLMFAKINKVEGRLNRLLGAHDVNHQGLRSRFTDREEEE